VWGGREPRGKATIRTVPIYPHLRINYRLHKKAFPAYIARFGEDILARAVFILYDKIKTYNLRYRDKNGNFKPVRFSSYIGKRIDGFILDSLKEELARERCEVSLDW
jgi:hypothetical protein